MELFLLRHAVAVEREKFRDRDDSRRPLAAEGEAKMRRAARGMRVLGLSFDLILSSPYLRARDTAAIAARVLAHGHSVALTGWLTPEADPEKIICHLAGLRGARSVLLVGHEPHLGLLLATLLGVRAPASLKLKKGALCRLTVAKLRTRPVAKLEWLLTSGHLARLAD